MTVPGGIGLWHQRTHTRGHRQNALLFVRKAAARVYKSVEAGGGLVSTLFAKRERL
jgi:hypothetical protein